jgi:hypothetical protein
MIQVWSLLVSAVVKAKPPISVAPTVIIFVMNVMAKVFFTTIRDFLLKAESGKPLVIAETLMGDEDQVPMLGCENAWIATGALMAALKNEGTIKVTNDHIDEVLNRTRKQAIGGYCGLTGVCGIAPAIGACFSVILGAACPKDQETATTMRVVVR